MMRPYLHTNKNKLRPFLREFSAPPALASASTEQKEAQQTEAETTPIFGQYEMSPTGSHLNSQSPGGVLFGEAAEP